MTLLLALGTARLSQVPHIRGVSGIYEFVKCTTIPGVESKLNSRANIFGARYESDILQDNRLKTYHLLDIPLPSLYAVKIH